jgi:flagellar basal-body rod modification protein FlgD
MIPSLTNGTSGTQQSSATQPGTASAATASSANSMVSEQTFLQLLVAQLENQDPDSPQDGTQFVAELAQFSSVEQELQMRTDLDNMNSIMTADQSQQASTTPSSPTNPNSTTTPQP